MTNWALCVSLLSDISLRFVFARVGQYLKCFFSVPFRWTFPWLKFGFQKWPLYSLILANIKLICNFVKSIYQRIRKLFDGKNHMAGTNLMNRFVYTGLEKNAVPKSLAYLFGNIFDKKIK